jgi:Rod binding domain-containing protein
MDGIRATLAEPTSATQRFNPPPPRLVKAAHEFEAQMMKELLKPMTESPSFAGDDDDSGAAGTMSGFASEALGKSLSEQGGFGIANNILRALSQKGESFRGDASFGNIQENSKQNSAKP